MNPTVQAVSPFAMLIDPEAVLAAVQRSERLSGLQGRICRPLDRQSTPTAAEAIATDDVQLLGDAGEPSTPASFA
jgi:hypothetical protein